MRIKAIKSFTDVETRLITEAGTVFEADEERAAELVAKGYAEYMPMRENEERGEDGCQAEPLTSKRAERKSK